MKKTRTLLNSFLCSLLALLGFSGCQERVPMYGVPQLVADFSGSVADKEGNPIEGIEVKLLDGRQDIAYATKTRSNENGQFSIRTDLFYSDIQYGDSILITAADVDGEENGSYQADTLRVPYPEMKDVDGWLSEGKTEGINFRLEEKPNHSSEE
ncbi:MAG: radical SAM-associated putative lipoprotein [Bacteroidales bacterium]|nr:radical SAM-associated putative lipoprotein [Candidatus Colicola faecequi]